MISIVFLSFVTIFPVLLLSSYIHPEHSQSSEESVHEYPTRKPPQPASLLSENSQREETQNVRFLSSETRDKLSKQEQPQNTLHGHNIQDAGFPSTDSNEEIQNAVFLSSEMNTDTQHADFLSSGPRRTHPNQLPSSAILRTTEQTVFHERQDDKSSPDDYKVELDLEYAQHFRIDARMCPTDYLANIHEIPAIHATSGVVYLINAESTKNGQVYCQWNITVPTHRFIAARTEFYEEKCSPFVIVYVYDSGEQIGGNSCLASNFIYSSSSTLNFRMVLPTGKLFSSSAFYLIFTTVTHDGKRFLPAFMTSSTTGYVTSVGFSRWAGYAMHINATYTLVVPSDHVVTARFRRVDIICCGQRMTDKVTVYELQDQRRRVAYQVFGQQPQPVRVHNTSLVVEMLTYTRVSGGFGFRMEFSFHNFSDAPVIYANGSINCSGPNYATFKQHVQCDLLLHCVDGVDEGGHCPFSSQLCKGHVALGSKCYHFTTTETMMTWEQTSRMCKERGGILAVMRTAEERAAMRSIFDHGGVLLSAFVGLQKAGRTLPKMYWQMSVWSDQTVAYNANFIQQVELKEKGIGCALLDPRYPRYFSVATCTISFSNHICEFDNKNTEAEISGQYFEAASVPYVDTPWSDYTITKCPSGHVTFSFLSCEPSLNCSVHQHQLACTTLYPQRPKVRTRDKFNRDARTTGSSQQEKTTPRPILSGGSPLTQGESAKRLLPVTVAMFVCDVTPNTLPYSLVCDFVPDCPRGSDETFCYHGEKCQELTCANAQCISYAQKCDNGFDCLDDSDEVNCQPIDTGVLMYNLLQRLPSPTIIYFDGRGDFFQRPMQKSESCPETHFPCLGVESHCLPVYVRCNGVYDCPGHEDEEACVRYTCPRFYRCRESSVCVHVNHTCDGWPQCPQRDDERYCELTCPPDCLCQGLAVVCSVTFPAWEYPQTRYLDASHSHMQPAELIKNTYLVWLSLASCNIDRVSNLTWPNVKFLDLSRNHLQVANMDIFLQLQNLQTLILAGNPLISLASSSLCSTQGLLKSIALSKTKLREFDSSRLSCYPHITDLNVSHCPLDKITDKGFQSTTYLTRIDLRGSPVSHFPRDIFKKLYYLKSVWAANYRLCCKATLPLEFNVNFCLAPHDEISSCDDLLKSNMFRVCIWMFSVLAVVGNVCCFFYKVSSKHKNPLSGFNVFVTNLTVADFLMGVYLVTVGVADEVYRGQYMWYDTTWKSSTACAVAGFLSLLSSEMSAFTICLITLDRFIVLTFPFTRVRFEGLSAIVTCVLLWTVGVILTSVPLFPVMSGWAFYSQTGICIPLPITRMTFPGQDYAFGIMIILNFVLCVLIAVGQASIYWSVRANSMKVDSSRKSQDLVIARRLFTVAASDFLCWFPIGLLGVLASNDMPVPSEISVAMAVIVLPLNSALNPFLYTFNVVMEKRRKVREAQLIKLLEDRVLSQKRAQQCDCICGRHKPEQLS